MSSESPLVTIGLPVYNSERYLEQSLDSLLGQTYSDFVLIINDNASTDGTADICRRYAEADSRVQYFRNETNIGNPRNFKRVFERTTTPYLKWSTADDFWGPTFVERALEVMESDPSIVLCYPKTYVVEGDGEPQPYEDNLHLVGDDPAERFVTLIDTIGLSHQHLGLIRTSTLRKTHLLRTHVASDIVLLAELALYGKIYELPDRLFYRRFHEKSGSWKRGDEQHEAALYHAANARNTGLTAWQRQIGHFLTVRSAPLPLASKIRLHRYLARQTLWSRDKLANELVRYARARLS